MRTNYIRLLLRLFAQFVEFFLTRTTVTGLENIPTTGAVIFAANHASTYDPVVLMNYLPPTVYTVGPGDFKLLFPANLIVERLNVILIQRGAPDRDSLKRMIEVLKAGHQLALFPEGGTWEKRLDDVKPGAAYLSLMTGAQVVPVAIGGSYQVWSKIFRLQRPQITIHFEPPLPPVTNQDRKNRQQDLSDASMKLMRIIYQHLPPADQERYDLAARQKFSAQLEFAPALVDASADFPVLAEIISKPNLFSPLYQNLKLPLQPLRATKRFHPASEFLVSANALLHAFKAIVPGYLNYRLGDRKAEAALLELENLRTASQQALAQDVAMRFTPQIQVLDDPLPPNV